MRRRSKKTKPIAERIILMRVREGTEALVQQKLHEGGARGYHPKSLVNTRNGMQARPLFPGYLFTWVNDAMWMIARRLQDVFGFVSFGDQEIQSVPADVIRRFRSAEGPTGYIPQDLKLFPGEIVRLRNGLEGKYLGMNSKFKARVLFEIIGQPTEFDFYIGDLDLVAA